MTFYSYILPPGVLKALLLFWVVIASFANSQAQALTQSGSFLLTVSRDTVPQGEVWKITGGFGASTPSLAPPSPETAMDTAALAKKYRDMYNLDLSNIKTQDLKGGMVMKDILPIWLAEGSRFSVDPGDLMELFVERYKISEK